MKTLLISVCTLMFAGTALTQGNRMPNGKADNNQQVKISAFKLAEARAYFSKATVRQNKINLATADGGI